MRTIEKRENRRELKVSGMTGWDLVCLFNHGGTVVLDIPENVQKAIFQKTWSLQDGYGVAGYTPVQGWDWSGIRDSSDTAKVRMGAAILAILASLGVTHLKVEDRKYDFVEA